MTDAHAAYSDRSLVSISDKAHSPVLSLNENCAAFRDAGFTHVHFSHKWREPEPLTEAEEAEWADALSRHGLRVLDAHGCHPPGIDLSAMDESDREAALALFLHRMQVTRRLGGDAMVYHVPTREPVPDQRIELMLESLKRVEEPARSLGIAIALENHYLPDVDQRALEAAFEQFDADFIGFTFDPGHALISDNTDWILRNCGPRLRVLHLNDNDGKRDRHWLPLDPEGRADWPAIMRFIADSPYEKPLQFEVRWSEERHGAHDEFLAKAFASEQALRSMISEVAHSADDSG